MKDGKFFTHPVHDWQRRYDALRASFVERLPARAVGERFNYSPTYVRLLRHLFMQGKIDFAEPVAEGKTRRRRVDAAIREKIRDWRWQKLSAGEITECLSEDGHEIFVHTVERVLREEGFPKLPRRTRLKMKITVKGGRGSRQNQEDHPPGDQRPEDSLRQRRPVSVCPFVGQLEFDKIIRSAGLPGSKIIAGIAITCFPSWR